MKTVKRLVFVVISAGLIFAGCGENASKKNWNAGDTLANKVENKIDDITKGGRDDADFLSDAIEANTKEIYAGTG